MVAFLMAVAAEEFKRSSVSWIVKTDAVGTGGRIY
jgi:hypothetical protein